MHKLLSFLIIPMVASLSMAQANPDLEEWADGRPVGWAVTGIVTEESQLAHSGSKSARLHISAENNEGASVRQAFAITPNGQWVGAHVYLNGLSQGLIANVMLMGYTEGRQAWSGGGTFEIPGVDWRDKQVFFFVQPGLDGVSLNVSLQWIDQPIAGSVVVDDIQWYGFDAQSVEPDYFVPTTPSLVSLYPNPFNGNAFINYQTEPSGGILTLLDPMGRSIASLPVSGVGKVEWEQVAGKSLPAGRYHLVLSAGNTNKILPAVYLK